MVQESVRKPAKDSSQLLKSFIVSGSGTVFSRIIGAARDLTISHVFGASRLTDIFFVAFTIPNVFRRFVADEGLTGALIPALAHEEKSEGREAAEKFSHTAFTFLILANIILCVAGITFAPWIVTAFGYGFSDNAGDFALAVRLTRWLFPFLTFVSLVSFFEGILNYRHHFFLPKIAPGVVSASIIIAALSLPGIMSEPVFSLVIGVLVGGVIHLVIVLPPVFRLWVLPRLRFAFNDSRFRLFMKEIGKVILIGIFAQINIMVLRSLASLLPAGSVTWFWNANRLIDLFQGIIAVGIGSALLPSLSEALARDDWDEAQTNCLYSLRFAAFLLVPIGAGVAVMAVPTVSVLFRHGQYSFHDVVVTGGVLFSLIPFMWSVAAINIIKKLYFALNLRTPLLIFGAVGTALTFVSGLLFMNVIGIAGLGLALSAAAFIQLLVSGSYLMRRYRGKISFAPLVSPLAKIFMMTLPLVLILHFGKGFGVWKNGPSIRNLLCYFISWMLAFLLYFLLAHAVGMEEFADLKKLAMRRIRRRSAKS